MVPRKGDPGNPSTMAGRHPRQMAWELISARTPQTSPACPWGAPGLGPLTTAVSRAPVLRDKGAPGKCYLRRPAVSTR